MIDITKIKPGDHIWFRVPGGEDGETVGRPVLSINSAGLPLVRYRGCGEYVVFEIEITEHQPWAVSILPETAYFCCACDKECKVFEMDNPGMDMNTGAWIPGAGSTMVSCCCRAGYSTGVKA